jgi:hypothetical protein
MRGFLDNADHVLPFLIAITFAVFGVRAVLVYGFKRVGWNGPAAFFK